MFKINLEIKAENVGRNNIAKIFGIGLIDGAFGYFGYDECLHVYWI